MNIYISIYSYIRVCVCAWGTRNGLSKHQSHEIIQKSTSQSGWGKSPTKSVMAAIKC